MVEAVLGTGERLVSGAATPDQWVVRGDSAVHRGSGEEAIDAAVARAVAALARQVEQHQGCPQDVEWALAGDTVVLLQARPITTLCERPMDLVPVPAESPHGYWLREASHAPVPWMPLGQAWLRLRTPALRGTCEQLGLLFETLDIRDIGGWEYFRIVPIGGKDRPAPPKALVPLVFRLVPTLRRRVRECVTAMRADVAGNLVRRWYQEWQPDLARRETELRTVDLRGLTDVDLDAHTARLVELIGLGLRMHFDLHGAIGVTLANLAFTCRDLLGDEALAFDLLAGLSEKSTEPSRALARLADLADRLPALKRRIIQRAPVDTVLAEDEAFAAAFAEFLGTHGCRALRYEIAEPNLMNDPTLCSASSPISSRLGSTRHKPPPRWPSAGSAPLPTRGSG